MKRVIGIVLTAGFLIGLTAAPRLMEIHTASNNILVAVFKSSVGNVDEVDLTLSGWSINGKAPAGINKYVYPDEKSDHFIYLTTDPLVEGIQYIIHTPYADTTITFSERTIFCESIKSNQSAYSALAKNNYALFAIWLGDGGTRGLPENLPEYVVFEQATGNTVTDGELVKIGWNASSGDTVYKIDLSKVPEGGPYQIAVKGYGCSYPFGVGGDFSKRLAYTMFRGQYYQRCGCPIIPPYGLDIRKKPCHTTVYKTNAPNSEASLAVKDEPSFFCVGGYHDAGDADRRMYHMAVPVIDLMVYEVFPDLFTDKQFNIPDQFDADYNITGSGNGIPDIIDEAAWGTLVWEYLQNDDGSIQFGTNTTGYPEPFEAPLDKDTKKYGTIEISDDAAAIGAGLFTHLGRILKPYDKARSDELIERGERSFNYVKDRMADPEKLYYYIQKYLLDGDEEAHAQVKALKTAVNKFEYNIYTCSGYQINDSKFDNPGYIMSYIVEKDRPTDPEVVDYFKNALKIAADLNIRQIGKSAYPVGNNPTGTAWGHNVMQPLFACAPLLWWKLTGDQSYFDGAAEMLNYSLGVNPLGVSYAVGLGFRQIHNPHDREFAYAKQMDIGIKPGITIFGPGVIQSYGSTPTLRTWPPIDSLPVERKFGDDRNSISTAEYTIFETMTHYALYTVLAGGGTWDASKDPYSVTIGVTKGNTPHQRSAAALSGACNGRTLILSVILPQASAITGGLYRVDGRKIADFDAGMLTAGVNRLSVPVHVVSEGPVASGIVLCRIRTGDRILSSGSVIWRSR